MAREDSCSATRKTLELVEAAARHVRGAGAAAPEIGIVLGSGLGDWVERMDGRVDLPYAEIPGMAVAHVPGHRGTLCLGRSGSRRVACLRGRVHAYEGHPVERVVFGVRLLAALGCQAVLLTNAAGGIRADLAPGSLMLITDHLNLTGRNPLEGWRPDDHPSFVDLSEAYDPALRVAASEAARQRGIGLSTGVYAGLLGPSYETPAEIRMLRALGADAVGMSTVLEVIALRERGLRVGAVSCITNSAAGLSEEPLSHADVQATAARVRDDFTQLLDAWVAAIP